MALRIFSLNGLAVSNEHAASLGLLCQTYCNKSIAKDTVNVRFYCNGLLSEPMKNNKHINKFNIKII